MSNEKKVCGNSLYSLISLDEFKALLGVDDRDDKIARFCLVTATHTIEQYCMRRLLLKKHTDLITFRSDPLFILKEYPVVKLQSVIAILNEKLGMRNEECINLAFYRVIPELGCFENLPFRLDFSNEVMRNRRVFGFMVIYQAGYALKDVPADLKAACFELAAWNFNRYRGKRIGMTGNVRGNGKDGEHFEMAMPSNVRLLLEPYRRKTI